MRAHRWLYYVHALRAPAVTEPAPSPPSIGDRVSLVIASNGKRLTLREHVEVVHAHVCKSREDTLSAILPPEAIRQVKLNTFEPRFTIILLENEGLTWARGWLDDDRAAGLLAAWTLWQMDAK